MKGGSNTVIKWFVRAGLYGSAAVSLLLSPLAFFLGLFGADNPTGSQITIGLLVMPSPFVIALLLIGMAIWVELHPRYNAHMMPLVCCIVSGGGFLGYKVTHPGRQAPPQLTEGRDFRAHGPSFYDPIQSDRWTALLRSRFPVGSSAIALENVLRDEHFGFGKSNIGPDAGPHADYTWADGSCFYSLQVLWNASPTGRIVSIKGSSNFVTCNKPGAK